MPNFPLVGPGYQGRSTNVNASRCVNLYPEVNGKDSKSETSLVGTPGSVLALYTGTGVVRGSHVFNGLMYVVIGSNLYSITTGMVQSGVLGTLSTSSGRVVMSDNGVAPTGGNQLCMTDGANTYIYDISGYGFKLVSTTSPTLTAGIAWSPVIWNGTIFLTVGQNTQSSATSTDGKTWTIYPTAMPLAAAWISVAWNGVTFCAIAGDVNGTTGATSTTGATWTAQTLPAAGAAGGWYSICAMGTKFCMVSYNTNTAATSTTGATSSWTTQTLPYVDNWQYIYASSSLYVALSNSAHCATSGDGHTWAGHAMPASVSWNGGASNGTNYLAVGTDGTHGYAATSPTGTTWTGQTIPNAAYNSVAWLGSVYYAASSSTASTGAAASSPDGATWTPRTMPYISGGSGNYWVGIAVKNSGYLYYSVAVTVTGYVAYALNGSNFNGGSFIQVGNPSSIAAYTCCCLSGYFILDIGGNQWVVSNLYDGTTLNPLNGFSATSSTDSLLSVFNNHGELWLFGGLHTEVDYLTGQASPLFAQVSGGVLDYGCAARYSVAKGNNTIYWLATVKDNDGGEFTGVACANGYAVQVVSTQAINWQIAQYIQTATVSDAWGYVFSMEGHEFYRITFPSANGGNGATWQMDTATLLWNEVMTYPYNWANNGRHIANTYAFFNNKHYVGSYLDGSIYEMNAAYFNDYGNAIVSTRISPPLADKEELKNIFVNRVLLDMETGTGSFNSPTSYSVSASITVGINPVGITTANGLIWGCCGGVFVINPQTNSILTTISFPYNSQYITYDGNYLWVSTNSGRVIKISPTLFTVLSTINVSAGADLRGITNGAGYIWVASYSENEVYAINPMTLAVTTITGLSYPTYVLYAAGMIWVSNVGSGTISVINPETLAIVSTVSSYGYGYELTYDGTSVWAAANYLGKPYAVKINATTYTKISAIDMSALTTNATFMNYDGSHIWALNSVGTNTLIVIDPVANVILSNYAIFTQPWQSVLYNGYMWVVDRTGADSVVSVAVGSAISASLSWSQDGGHTWSTPILQSLGAWASYLTRVIWYRIGMARQWAFNFTLSGSHKKVLLSGVVDYKSGRF